MKKSFLVFFSILIVLSWSCKKADSFIKFENNSAAWQINPNEYQHFMSVVGLATESKDTNDVLAIYIGDELHGFSSGELHNGRVIHFVLAYSNKTKVKMGFRLYQSKNDQVIGAPDSIIFKSGGGVGTPDNPYEIKF